MKRRIYFLFFFSGLIACQAGKGDIHQLWFYTYSGDGSTEKNALTPANFLELRADQSFTSDLGKFHAGHWEQKDQQLFLHADDGEINIILLNSLKPKEMQVRIGDTDAANFDAQPLPPIEKDPFSKTNNLWRIKASSRETEQQLKSRLKNHCGFWSAYFTWALEIELETIDVRSTPTPIKIYGNGFTIKPYKDLPESWKGYFYDSADCLQADRILMDVVRTHTIAWAHTDNKYKMFISAFQQMERYLK